MSSPAMTIASRWWEEWPRSAILLLTLLLWSVLGLLTPYLLILVGIVIAIRLAVRGHVSLFYASLGAKLFLIAFFSAAALQGQTALKPEYLGPKGAPGAKDGTEASRPSIRSTSSSVPAR